MPYNPGISYRGDQYIAQGISSLGQNVGQSIFKIKEDLDKAKEDKAADDILFGLAQQQNMLNPEEQARYLSGDTKERNGIIAGTLRKFALNFQQQQLESLQEQRAANADYRRMQMQMFPLQQQSLIDERKQRMALAGEREDELFRKKAATTWTPTKEDEARAAAAGHAYTYDPVKGYQITPITGGGDAETIPFTDASGKVTKVSVRSGLGQNLLAQTNPELSLQATEGLTRHELFNKDIHEAGNVDATGKFTPDKNGTHIRIGGETIMTRPKFNFYKKRLEAAGQTPDAATPAPAAAPTSAAAAAAPKVGEVKGGYKFKGGNPADPKNWEKVS